MQPPGSPTLGSLRYASNQQLEAFDLLVKPINETTEGRFRKDIKILESLGITARQIADKLQTIILKTEQLYENALPT